MSDVSALMDKLKSTVNYRQFDAPRASDQAWPVLERMARAQSALSRPDTAAAPMAPPAVAQAPIAQAPVAPAPVAPVEVAPVAEPPANGSLFDRLQVDGRARAAEAELPKGAAFSRYGAAKAVEPAPQDLSEIFERIGRKAL